MIVRLIVFLWLIGGGGGMPLAPEVTPPVFHPEYLKVLGELTEKQRVLGERFEKWRDSEQWLAVAYQTYDINLLDETDQKLIDKTMRLRYELSMAVMRYPLWQRLPASAVISPEVLTLWNSSQKTFIGLLRTHATLTMRKGGR